MGYKPKAVVFDGSTAYLDDMDVVTTVTDGDVITIASWLKPDVVTGTAGIMANQGNRLILSRETDGVRLVVRNPAFTLVLQLDITSCLTVGQWTHVVFSANLTTGVSHGFANGLSTGFTETTLTTSETMDLQQSNYVLGAASGGANKFDGELCDCYIADAYIDLSVGANLAKFYNAGAVDPLLTGQRPFILAARDYNTPALNHGNFWDYQIVNGTYSEGTAPPENPPPVIAAGDYDLVKTLI